MTENNPFGEDDLAVILGEVNTRYNNAMDALSNRNKRDADTELAMMHLALNEYLTIEDGGESEGGL